MELYTLAAKPGEQCQPGEQSRPTIGAASDAVGGHGVFAVLGDRPHRQLVLPQGHRSCLLQDGDSLPRDTLGHLTGHCLDNTAGCGDGGEGDRWLLVYTCGRAQGTRISHYPGLEAGFILINTLAGIHSPGLQYLSRSGMSIWKH